MKDYDILPKNIERRAEAYADSKRDVCGAPDWDTCKDMFLEGAKDTISIIDFEIQRTICEDYGDFTDEDREIVQGALARLHYWIENLKKD